LNRTLRLRQPRVRAAAARRPTGSYRILLRGICFDACFDGDGDECFIFNVCKD
jgi:hypothetical protein